MQSIPRCKWKWAATLFFVFLWFNESMQNNTHNFPNKTLSSIWFVQFRMVLGEIRICNTSFSEKMLKGIQMTVFVAKPFSFSKNENHFEQEKTSLIHFNSDLHIHSVLWYLDCSSELLYFYFAKGMIPVVYGTISVHV